MTYLIKLGIKSIQVEKQVDSCIGEGRHTSIVVSSGINMIYTDRVGPKVCHQARVKTALGPIRKGVVIRQLIGDACIRVSD